jgi:hypothetical protein
VVSEKRTLFLGAAIAAIAASQVDQIDQASQSLSRVRQNERRFPSLEDALCQEE